MLRKPRIIICTAYPLHVRIFTFLPDLAQMLLNPTFVLLRFILFKKLKKNKFNCWEGSILQCFDILLTYAKNFGIFWKSIQNHKSGWTYPFQTWTPWSGAMCVYSNLSHDKLKYVHMAPLHRVHVWNEFSDMMKKKYWF